MGPKIELPKIEEEEEVEAVEEDIVKEEVAAREPMELLIPADNGEMSYDGAL